MCREMAYHPHGTKPARVLAARAALTAARQRLSALIAADAHEKSIAAAERRVDECAAGFEDVLRMIEA